MTPSKIRKFTIENSVRRSAGRRGPRVARWLSGLFGRRRRTRGPKKGRRRTPRRPILTYLAVAVTAALLAGTVGFIGLYAWVSRDLPDPGNLITRQVAESTKIYDRTGEHVLYEFHGDEKRTLVELDFISPHVINATLVAEDRKFYEHRGFSLKGYARAVITNLQTGGRGQGGSTITQQFVKNAVLSPEKTYIRKLKELILSVEIERRFSKDDILKMYLNEIPYGSVVYGIEQAAQTFLDKSSSDLTVSEAALLAALPQRTTYFSPYGSHIDELLARQNWIVDGMVELGYITPEQAEEAKADDVLARVKPRGIGIVAPHFVFHVREQLAEEFGEQILERGGLKVVTTLDVDKQLLAEEIILEQRESLDEWGASNAALLSYEPRTGDILTMVGSADYFDDEISGKYNALLGLRQPGSSIKPFVYAAGFERGYTPNTVIYDVETEFGRGPNPYTPKNNDLSQRGPVTVREALAGSLNIPAVKMLYLAGLDSVISLAERVGYTTLSDRDRFGLSLALGGGEVRPIEHVSAFSVFANEGRMVPTRSILSVTDRDGNVILEADESPDGRLVMDREVARQVTSILSDNAARAFVFGENSYLNLGVPAAAKTGTTNSYKDAWTVGFTPSLVTGVWVGNSDGAEMKQGAGGSRMAAPIWNAYMRRALEGVAPAGFTEPQPIETGKQVLDGQKATQVMLKIDSVTGKLATEYTPEELIEERGFGVPHSILYFVDREDPRGPEPADPSQDPMFEQWEAAVSGWAKEQEIEIEEVPTEFDDVHLPENVPTVRVRRPKNGTRIDSRIMDVDVEVFAKLGVGRVEFALNGDKFDELQGATSGTVFIPNRFSKGFHTMQVTGYDTVGNRQTAEVTVNLTADAGPIGVRWIKPQPNANVSSGSFPYTLQFSIEDYRSVERLEVSAKLLPHGSEEMIGSIRQPPLQNMSMKWTSARPGHYRLRLSAWLTGGEQKSEEILVTVR
ncbi:transglycosylase domain-containing protein [Patescibacteria group bacterium]